MSATLRFPLWLWAIVTGVFVWSAIAPKDRFTWFLEVLPAILGAIVLLATRKHFPLTPLLQTLIAIHMIILMVGGHYTYAEVPLFNYLRDVFHLSRNHYDRVGHFAQGFVPAIIAREVLLRRSPLVPGKWLSFIVICICLAISAVYELFEWTVAVLTGESATAFLGTQGDVWDTQKDMAFCAVGAICAVIPLSKWHNRQLKSHLDGDV